MARGRARRGLDDGGFEGQVGAGCILHNVPEESALSMGSGSRKP